MYRELAKLNYRNGKKKFEMEFYTMYNLENARVLRSSPLLANKRL